MEFIVCVFFSFKKLIMTIISMLISFAISKCFEFAYHSTSQSVQNFDKLAQHMASNR